MQGSVFHSSHRSAGKHFRLICRQMVAQGADEAATRRVMAVVPEVTARGCLCTLSATVTKLVSMIE